MRRNEGTLYKRSYFTWWLALSCALVIIIMLIGGFTRLTNSGLSIVEWKPISGVIPPLNELDWQTEFNKYQTSPEYQQHNSNINLTEFKFIFWLEFIHRLAARVAGLMYLLPLLYFYAKGQVTKSSRLIYFSVAILFFMQGFIGWYMVKSGLVDKPYVSHYRLACHLIIAVVIYSLLFWQLMKYCFDILIISSKENLTNPRWLCLLSLILLYWQIFLGGLVAGLDAGLIYNDFPLMGANFIPREINFCSLSLASLSDSVFVQFTHRVNSYLITIVIVILTVRLLGKNHPKLRKVAILLFLSLGLQMLAGIFTILYSVPTALALIHQFLAIILLSILLWCYFLLKNT